MRKRLVFGAGIAALGLLAWGATAPAPTDAALFDGLSGDSARGELVFAAMGCASCHSAEATDALAGGKAFVTAFGTFYAPNISTDGVHGIGGWSDYDLANAITAGVSPDGAHYYPAFPYTSYNKTAPQDVMDAIAYLRSLPADATPSRGHDVGFPFNMRRSLGVWKLLFETEDWVVAQTNSPDQARGRYLVEALGHCAECHSPRTALGGLDRANWMRGADNPSGDGRIPSIHPDDLGWSAFDIAIYLESGFTPDFDTVGGSMVDVVDNTSKLTDEDRTAIAAYLISLK